MNDIIFKKAKKEVFKISRETIAKKLKELRENVGLTVYQVGEKIGKSGKTVSAWENNHGQPDAEILMKLCDIYKVDDILAAFREDNKVKDQFKIDEHEIKVIKAYRNHPEMQPAIDKMLDIKENENISEDMQRLNGAFIPTGI